MDVSRRGCPKRRLPHFIYQILAGSRKLFFAGCGCGEVLHYSRGLLTSSFNFGAVASQLLSDDSDVFFNNVLMRFARHPVNGGSCSLFRLGRSRFVFCSAEICTILLGKEIYER